MNSHCKRLCTCRNNKADLIAQYNFSAAIFLFYLVFGTPEVMPEMMRMLNDDDDDELH